MILVVGLHGRKTSSVGLVDFKSAMNIISES